MRVDFFVGLEDDIIKKYEIDKMISKEHDPQKKTYRVYSNLKILEPKTEQLLAMKILAARPEPAKDFVDAYILCRELNITTKKTFTAEKSTSRKDILIEKRGSVTIQILELFVGIILVIGSSKILIPAVEISAVRVGIPQSIIAATLIALGTSLPELVTAITAVRKGHGELAIGNVVGANILNVLFVVGGAAAVTLGGLDVPLNFYKLQIPTMLVILIVFWLFSKDENKEIDKKEGCLLLLIYIVYLILNFTWFTQSTAP